MTFASKLMRDIAVQFSLKYFSGLGIRVMLASKIEWERALSSLFSETVCANYYYYSLC